MFCIREIIPADLPKVYRFTISLLEHHIGQCNTSLLDEPDFFDIFERGYLKGLLLSYREVSSVQNSGQNVQTFKPIGCMLYYQDLSTVHGKGIYLDQFYIEPEFRGRGLGRVMMAKLCEKSIAARGQYIRLTFQSGLGLEKVYGNMGFVNCSKSYPGLHLFEAWGRPKLREFLDIGEVFEKRFSENLSSIKHPPVKLVLPLEDTAKVDCSLWSGLNMGSAEGQSTSFKDFSPPKPRLVLVTDGTFEGVSADNASRDNYFEKSMFPLMAPQIEPTGETAQEPKRPRMCMFTEQISVCSWLGPMVNFSDFIGDTSLLQPHVLFSRVHEWLQIEPNLRGASWEVPCGVETHPKTDLMSLENSLNQLNIPDDTRREGWNLAYLDEVGMRRLLARPLPNGISIVT